MTSPRGAELIAQDRSRLLGSVSLALFGQGAAFAFGLLCMVLTVRLLGPENYGRLAMFFLILAVLSQLLVSWPNMGLVRFGREELAERGAAAASFWARAVIFLATLLLAAGLLWIFRGPLERYLGLGFAPHFLLLAYLALNEAIALCRALFQTVSRFRSYALSNSLVRLFILTGLTLLYLLLSRSGKPAGAAVVLEVHVAALTAVTLVCLTLLPWSRLKPPGLNTAQARRMLSYSWPLMLGGLSVLVVDWVDLAVIKHFRSGAEVGLYAVAYQPVTVLSQLRVAVIAALLPLLISMGIEKRHESLTWFLDDAAPQAAWGIGLCCTVAAGLAELIPPVLGEKFAPSIVPAQVLMAGVAFSMFGAIQTAVAQAFDKLRAAAAVLIALALFNTAGDLLLVPVIGILGAAIATTAAFAISGLLYFPVLNAIEPLRSGASGRRYLALAGLLPALLFAILAVLLNNPAQRLIACAAVLLVALLAAKWIGVFKRATMDRMERVQMPGWAREGLRKFYAILGR